MNTDNELKETEIVSRIISELRKCYNNNKSKQAKSIDK